MAAALTLADRGRGRTAPNPNVGCVIVRDGMVVGRGWTQAGGRPHAEAMALSEAGEKSRGATCHVTLEPCAHVSPRGPACSDLLLGAGVARVVAAIEDPDPRTAGRGMARLAAAGIATTVGVLADQAWRAMAGFLTRQALARPFVTLKLATSLDGCIAMAGGESRWITGPEARAHAHLERARHEAILVGRGTWEVDRPRLDVRLPGLESRSPMRVVLTRAAPPLLRSGEGGDFAEPPSSCRARPGIHRAAHAQAAVCANQWMPGRARHDVGKSVVEGVAESDGLAIFRPTAIADLPGVDHLLVEGGAGAAAAFLAADLVDRLLLYRAPILIGGGLPALGDIGLARLADAHGRWRLHDARQLGSDRLEVYERARDTEKACSPASSPT